MQPGGFGGPGNGQPPGGYPPGYPGSPAHPGAQPGQQPYGAPQPQHAPQPYGAAQPHYGAPQQPYGAPGLPYGAAPPGAYGMPPGMGVAAPPGNSFGHAQSALAGAGGMMKAMKYGFIAIGGLCVLLGVVLLFAVDVITGISIAFTGAVFVVVALAVLPRFSGMLGQATAMVDGFAAKEQLAQTGIPAMGRLLSVQQTGRLVNYNPEIFAVVEVQHPQLGVYQTQTTAIVPQIAIPRAQPGAPVQVRVSPQNPHEVALVF